jgi:hypothetical protein
MSDEEFNRAKLRSYNFVMIVNPLGKYD